MTKINHKQFEKRKNEHISFALKKENEAFGGNGLEHITLIHEAIPNINFADLDITTKIFGYKKKNPFFVSSMTGGCPHAKKINTIIAGACQEMDWFMGIGSQRRQLTDPLAQNEWLQIKKKYPKVKLLSNIGITQIINTDISSIKKLIEPIESIALFVHTNPLQECLQIEGTPNFKGALLALEKLCTKIKVPVILKETGCGFSFNTLNRLNNIGIFAIDVSGYGGTHWGRIEGMRAKNMTMKNASTTFNSWGISTLDSIMYALSSHPDYKIWGSGGIRSGLDAAKVVAIGAQLVGFAKPILEKAIQNKAQVLKFMKQVEFEFKIALFCTGYSNISSFQKNAVWINSI